MTDLKEPKEIVSFRSGAIVKKNVCCLIAGADALTSKNLPNTEFITYVDRQWGSHLAKWSAVSICITQAPKEQMAAISAEGQVAIYGKGEDFEEQIGRGEDHPEKRGPLREVRTIAGRAYACGMDRQVYRREGPHAWTCIDLDMRKAPAALDVFGFESIHGFGETDLYAVGWHGEIWHFDGRRWSPIESPTNLILTRVFCAQDGSVYICGQQGMLIKGRGGRWRVIEHGETSEDFWDLQWFDGRLYLSTTRMLYRLAGERLERVDTGEEIPATCYHLDAADGILWSIGPKDILQFDGKAWTRIQ